jgi:thiol-disulfide isomerase/thioredoxin
MLTDQSLYPSLEALDRPALVAFGTPGCGACRRLRALLPELSAALPEVAVFYAEADRCPGVLADLEAFHLPALFVFRDGDAHAGLSAPLSIPALVAAARAALDGPPTAP